MRTMDEKMDLLLAQMQTMSKDVNNRMNDFEDTQSQILERIDQLEREVREPTPLPSSAITEAYIN